jgi:23S rRNA (uracil1939-C5)-methyltransferase
VRPIAGTNTAEIEKLVYGGEGLSRINGQVTLTPFVLPGEAVEVGGASARHGVARARLLRIERASDKRVEPGCPYFGRCGGCHYQHSAYEYQLEQKVAILREVLRRIGKIEAPESIEVVSGQPWEYRNRSQFHLFEGHIGYLEAGSHRLCPVTHCPISSPRLNEVLRTLIAMMKDSRFPRFVRAIEVFSNETDVQVNVLDSERPVAKHFFDWCAEAIPGFQPGAIDHRGAGQLFRVSYKSFFQVNRFLVNILPGVALGDVSGERAVDLYAGVGLFSVGLSRRFSSVTAVESGSSAVRDLTHNAERADVHVDAVQSDVDDWLARASGGVDFVLADPPRAGLGKRAVAELIRIRPRRLHIVACDAATLARDLHPLLANGYRIERMLMVDLFPQTYHIETVVHLRT